MTPFLAIPAAGYYLVQTIRARAYRTGLLIQEKAPVPVISLGNILMGGAGKTPFAIYLAELLRARGFRPAIVSRGYGGSNREPYIVVGRGDGGRPLVEPSVSGDEPYLMSRRLPQVPVLVGRRRIHPVVAARHLFGSNVVILDDGFQHLPLARDVDIVLLNGSEDRMFPLGRLREPLTALDRAHLAILMGDETAVPSAAAAYLRGAPTFRCRILPLDIERGAALPPLAAGSFAGREVVLASGIAHPDRFRQTAERLGWLIREHWTFRDHHRFTDVDLAGILSKAGDFPVLLTEKDWVKLPVWFRGKSQVAALRIRVAVDEEEALLDAIVSRFRPKTDS